MIDGFCGVKIGGNGFDNTGIIPVGPSAGEVLGQRFRKISGS